MKSIKPFIDYGFHTVPLKGELVRLEDGKKTTPIFEAGWKVTYQETFNEHATSIGGVLTGEKNCLVAIDCDDKKTWELFKSLDPEYTFRFVSKGKEGGTLLYKFPHTIKTLAENFSLQTPLIKLDYFANNGFVYLPTDENGSKEAWDIENIEDFPDLFDMPQTIVSLLENLHQQYSLAKGDVQREEFHTSNRSYGLSLAPILELFLIKGHFVPKLFKILTPKDFRSLPEYVANGHLHPNDVPDGRGSEYLSKVSAILGSDTSVDEELYVRSIELINSLWDDPIPSRKLDSTIIDPMIEGKAAINGERIWQYDKHWESKGLSIHTKRDELVELFYDDIKQTYYVASQLSDNYCSFDREAEAFSHVEVISATPLKRPEMKRLTPLIKTVTQPELPSGKFMIDTPDGEQLAYNLFRQSTELGILNNPEPYAPLYKQPETILNFLETFIPNKRTRNYVLSFLRTKFTTFAYSPVVLYFLGTHGSGKDTFVNILDMILGPEFDYIARPTTNEFLEKHNGWIMDKYFVQLDEYGNQLQVYAQKQEALGKIKAYTGKDTIQIRQMRADGYNIKHAITFIMTANSNPLIVEEADRRILLISTPTPIAEADWVEAAGGMTQVLDKIKAEIKDFCYYLATEVKSLSMDEYNKPLASGDKYKLIGSMLAPIDKLVFCLKHSLIEEIQELIDIADYNPFTSTSYVSENKLYELLVHSSPDGQASKKSLTVALKKYGINKLPTTSNGIKDYKCMFPAIPMTLLPKTFEDQTTKLGDKNDTPKL